MGSSWLPPRQMLRPALILVLQGGEATDGLSCTGLQRLVVVMLQLSRDPAAHLLAGPIEVRTMSVVSSWIEGSVALKTCNAKYLH